MKMQCRAMRSRASKRASVKWQLRRPMLLWQAPGESIALSGLGLEPSAIRHHSGHRRFATALFPSVPSVLAIRWRLASGPF